MIIACPQCRQKLRAKDGQPGVTLRCPACRTEFRPAPSRATSGNGDRAVVVGIVAVGVVAVGLLLWQQEREAQTRREAEQGFRRFQGTMENLMRNEDPAAGVRRQLDNSPTDGYGRPRPGTRVYYDSAGNPIGYSRDGK